MSKPVNDCDPFPIAHCRTVLCETGLFFSTLFYPRCILRLGRRPKPDTRPNFSLFCLDRHHTAVRPKGN
uniref:Uncharacterized protein n=1 Tax=Anguilla anguilla TaxID=7936 RepID=A0A0E9RN13_ANGAN